MSHYLLKLKRAFASVTAASMLFMLFSPFLPATFEALAAETGTLLVEVQPQTAEYQVVDSLLQPIERNGETTFAGDRAFDLDVGAYGVVFLDHSEPVFASTPTPESVTITPNASETVSAQYFDGPILEVLVSPDEAEAVAEYEIFNSLGESVFNQKFSGDRYFEGLSVGLHMVVFDDVAGFDTTPGPLEAVVVDDTITTVDGLYSNAPPVSDTAILQITTLNAAGTITVANLDDGTSVDLGAPGVDATAPDHTVDTDMNYEIQFSDETGFTTPTAIRIPANTLVADSVNPYSGNYIDENNTATINVTTTPVAAEVFLDGASQGFTAASDTVLPLQVAAGATYSVSYGDVTDFVTATADTVLDTDIPNDGDEFDVVGAYIPVANEATLSVYTLGSVGEITATSVRYGTQVIGTPADEGQANALTLAIDSTEDYLVSFGDSTAPGFTTPGDEPVDASTVNPGDTVEIFGTYNLAGTVATLEITVNQAGNVTVANLDDPASSFDLGVQTPGVAVTQDIDVTVNYEIQFGDVTGFVTPNAISLPADRLAAGPTYPFFGNYVDETANAEINVTTFDNNGPVSAEVLLDDGTGAQSQGFTDAAGAMTISVAANTDYTVSYGDVTGYITPQADTVNAADIAADDSTVSVEGHYILDADDLDLVAYTTNAVGEITVTNDTTGEVTVLGTPVDEGLANALTLVIDTNHDYTVSFENIGGAFTQAPSVDVDATLTTADVNFEAEGVYTPITQATLRVQTTGFDGEITVFNETDGAVEFTTNSFGAFHEEIVDTDNEYTISFADDPAGTFATPQDIVIPANTLDVVDPTENEYIGVYTDATNTATITVTTETTANPLQAEVFVDDGTSGPLSKGFTDAATGQLVVNVEAGAPYTVSYGDVAAHQTADDDLVVAADIPGNGDNVDVQGLYIADTDAAILAVTTLNEVGTITITNPTYGTFVGNPQNPGDFFEITMDVNETYTVSFETLVGYDPIQDVTVTGANVVNGRAEITRTYNQVTQATIRVRTTGFAGEITVFNETDSAVEFTTTSLDTYFEQLVDIADEYTISFEDDLGGQFVTPPNITVPANTLDVFDPALNEYSGDYFDVAVAAIVNVTTEAAAGPLQAEVFVDDLSGNGPQSRGFTDAATGQLQVIVDTNVDYEFTFGAVDGHREPGVEPVLNTDTDIAVPYDLTATYTFVAAVLEVRTFGADAEVFLSVDGGPANSIGTTSGGNPVTEPINVDETNVISFASVPGFQPDPPADITIPANTETAGTTITRDTTYFADSDALDLVIYTTSTFGDVTVDSTTYGTQTFTLTGEGIANAVRLPIDTNEDYTVTFGSVGGFTDPVPNPVAVNASATTAGVDFEVNGVYTPNTASISITTADDAVPPALPGGGGVTDADFTLFNLTDGTNQVFTDAGEVVDVVVNAGDDYQIVFDVHPTDPTYTTPADIFFNLPGGAVRNYVGMYVHSCEVNLTKNDSAGTPLAGEVFVSIDGGPEFSIGSGDPANNFLVTFNADETRETVFRFDVPTPNPANVQPPAPNTFTVPAGTDPATCPINQTVTYQDPATDKALEVTVTNQDADVFVNGVLLGRSTVASGGTPAIGTIDVTVDNEITFEAIARFTTPDPINITANTLTAGAPAHTETVTYAPAPEVTVTKTASTTSARDNDVVTYTITVERTNDTINGGGNIFVNVADSVEPLNALVGPNGGALFVITGNGSCTIVGGGACSDQLIYEQPIDVTLAALGSIATIEYETRAEDGGISPVGGSDTITNTVTVTSADLPADIVTTEDVTLQHTPVVTGGGGGGGGGCCGGGHEQLFGDMELKIEKFVSLDGEKFVRADRADLAIVVPENETTRLYNKVRVTNLGEVSATKIKFKPFFETGDSDMTADKADDLEGAKWNTLRRLIVIDKVLVGETIEFTYSVDVHEHGQDEDPAFEGLELVSFGSNVPKYQDALTYLGLGDSTVTTLYAGYIPAGVEVSHASQSNRKKPRIPTREPIVNVQLNADKQVADRGDLVNLTFTTLNISDKDVTNVIVATGFDPAIFEINNAFGGIVNGSEVQFSRPVVRPGQAYTQNIALRVKADAPLGAVARSLTRVLVSERGNIAPAEHFMTILAGASSGDFQLAATGPMGSLLILLVMAISGAFGVQKSRELVYLRNKKLALQWL